MALSLGNTVLLSAYASLASEGSLGRGAALFLGLLLTLIIVLYDRFRAVRRTEFEREAELLRARSAPATGAV